MPTELPVITCQANIYDPFSDPKSKGMLEVEYEGGAKVLLDSWKLQNFRELVGFIEAHSPVTPSTKT